jgi:serine protease Do
MKDYYEFDERYHQNSGGVWKYIAIGLIFAILGAIFMFYMSPYVYERLGISHSLSLRDQPQDRQMGDTNEDNEQNPGLGAKGDLFIDSENPVIDIAYKVSPAVVGITNRSVIAFRDWFFGDVQEREQEGYGSGIIISEDGYIVTNAHVVANAEELFVILQGGQEVKARLIGADEHSDIAVIKIDKADLPVAVLGDSDKVRPGELAVAIGNPLGHDLSGTITAGVISAVNRRLLIDDRYLDLIQTDAAINPGNSGGPLVNSRGEVIGMNTLKARGAEGMGFAIPTNVFLPLVEQLKETGQVERPWIGIMSHELTAEEAAEHDFPRGIFVQAVVQNSPASQAGMRPGDIITGMDGQPIETFADLRDIIALHRVGDRVELKIWRDGEILEMMIRLAQMRN